MVVKLSGRWEGGQLPSSPIPLLTPVSASPWFDLPISSYHTLETQNKILLSLALLGHLVCLLNGYAASAPELDRHRRVDKQVGSQMVIFSSKVMWQIPAGSAQLSKNWRSECSVLVKPSLSWVGGRKSAARLVTNQTKQKPALCPHLHVYTDVILISRLASRLRERRSWRGRLVGLSYTSFPSDFLLTHCSSRSGV